MSTHAARTMAITAQGPALPAPLPHLHAPLTAAPASHTRNTPVLMRFQPSLLPPTAGAPALVEEEEGMFSRPAFGLVSEGHMLSSKAKEPAAPHSRCCSISTPGDVAQGSGPRGAIEMGRRTQQVRGAQGVWGHTGGWVHTGGCAAWQGARSMAGGAWCWGGYLGRVRWAMRGLCACQAALKRPCS